MDVTHRMAKHEAYEVTNPFLMTGDEAMNMTSQEFLSAIAEIESHQERRRQMRADCQNIDSYSEERRRQDEIQAVTDTIRKLEAGLARKLGIGRHEAATVAAGDTYVWFNRSRDPAEWGYSRLIELEDARTAEPPA